MIESVARKVSVDKNTFASIYIILESFLPILFDLTLTECGSSKDVTLRETVANAVYAMIRLYPHSYENLVQNMISTNVQVRNDPSLGPVLKKTFDTLTSDVDPLEAMPVDKKPHHPLFIISRNRQQAQGARAFRQKFDTFVTELIGLLRIK